MDILGALFGGSKTAEKTVDLISTSVKGIGGWIDEQDYTKEEKAVSMQKATDTALKLVKAVVGENGPSRVTRRYMAWGILLMFMTAFFTALYNAITGDKATVKAIVDVVEAFHLGWAFVALVTAYFGVAFARVTKD